MTPFRRTAPDWGYTPSQFMSPDYDLSEVAARSAEIKSYRRDGRIFYNDPCNRLGGWFVWTNAGYGPVIVDNTNFFDGQSSIKLSTATVAGFNSRINKDLPIVTPRPIGLEFVAACNNWALILQVEFHTYTSGNEHYFSWRIYQNQLWVYNAAGVYVSVGTFPSDMFTSFFSNDKYRWMDIKFIVNPLTGYYLRAYVNELEFIIDNSVTSAPTNASRMNVAFQTTAPDATPLDFYIDNLILTVDEYEGE